MREDLTAAVRRLRRKPAMAVVSALCLALGGGATAAIFGCLDGFYLRPLPVPRSGELVRIFGSTEQDSYGEISYPEYREIRSQCGALSSLGVAMRRGAVWLRPGDPQDLSIYLVSADFFQMLGAQPFLGRFFGPGEQPEPVAVLGYTAWQHWFGGDRSIIGRSIRLSRGRARNVTIVGVLPSGFRSLAPTGDQDIWIPPATFAAMDGTGWQEFEDPRNVYFEAIGRLRSGSGLAQVQAQLDGVTRRLAAHQPETNARRHLHALSDLGWRMHQAGTTALVLAAVVLLVVAISSVNVGNLLLAGLEARRKEIATRTALGAPRWRLARQLLLESTLTGAAGTAMGLLLGEWTLAAVPAIIGMPTEYRSELVLRLDARVLWASAMVAFAMALLSGAAVAASGSRADLYAAMRSSSTSERGRRPLRRYLALSQLVLSLVLLSGTAILGRSFWNARHGEIGLARKPVLAVWLSSQPVEVQRAALERLRALPGVRNASLAFRAPLSHSGGGIAMPVVLPGHPEFSGRANPVTLKFNSVEPAYFRVLGIRLLRGRTFASGDTESAPPVMVISESTARRYWPGQNPLGKFARSAPEGRLYEIIGVVADAPINRIGEIPEPYLYTCWWQNPLGEHTLLVETTGEPSALAPAVISVLGEIRREMKRAELFTMDQLIRDATLLHRATAQLVALLALLGLLLAAVGFYGVMAYGVAQRTREIGIRMALGARETQAAGLVIREALATVLWGIGIGLPCSLAAVWAIRSALFGVQPWHPPAFLAAALVLLVTALAAAALPARRAARVDPVVALRDE